MYKILEVDTDHELQMLLNHNVPENVVDNKEVTWVRYEVLTAIIYKNQTHAT